MKFYLSFILILILTSMNSQDWAQLDRYKEANAQLAKPIANEKRVVFMGNSITEGWKRPELTFFHQKGYINRGIGGQTTGQMKVRFWQDVIALQPNVVVILAGINDIAENTGHFISNQEIATNIADMAELARAYNIEVVICSILPANVFVWRPQILPAERVRAVNELLKEYAAKEDFIYLDFYNPMVNEEKGMIAAYTLDGVHCSLEGYQEMERIASKILNDLLR